jgi:hypothetical protein
LWARSVGASAEDGHRGRHWDEILALQRDILVIARVETAELSTPLRLLT